MFLSGQDDLTIYYMVPAKASCAGGTEVVLLCDKVQKGDIAVQVSDGISDWQTDAEITPTPGVFRQVRKETF